MVAKELPAPDIWLAEQLEKMHLTQNEMARRAKIASSALTNFANGNCGPQTAIDIANFFGVPATLTLAMIGKVPPPPAYINREAELLANIYQRLGHDEQQQLMSYAEHLRAKSIIPPHPSKG